MSGVSDSVVKLACDDRSDFVALFGGVYEHSPWVAEQAFNVHGPGELSDMPAIANAMTSVVESAGIEAKLGLLRAHPDLAGRLALRGSLTEASRTEQQSAGLDQCAPEELEKFTRLNEKYKAKFGFPFIIAVFGMHRADILKAFEHRVGNDASEEFSAALREVHKIAGIRLMKIFEGQA